MDNKYGKKIRDIRELNKDTLEDLGKKINISWSALGKFERGERKITPELLESVAKVYDVPITYFFGEQGNVPNELKQAGVEWITFAEEMNRKNLTPSEIKATIEFLEKLNMNKN